MKRLKSWLTWRMAVLAVLLFATLVLIGGDTDSEWLFYVSKLLGLANGYALYRCAKAWEKQIFGGIQ